MTIQLYTDDTSSNDHSFQVIASIWGAPEACDAYSKEVAAIIQANTRLGPDFKGLHSYRLGADNWGTLGPTYQAVLNKLFEFVSERKLGMQITLVSREKYEANAGYLKNLLKTQLENRESVIGKQFRALTSSDLPALYHRIDQLFVYLLYRDRFGSDGDEFEFYPDSVGKILSYREKEFPVSGSLPIEWPLPFNDLVKILGNSLGKVLNFLGWSKKQQDLVKFHPLKWEESHLIQSCDVLANFTFNHLRHKLGLPDEKYRLKSEALLKHLQFEDHAAQITSTFRLNDDGTDVVCTDASLLATIEIIGPAEET